MKNAVLSFPGKLLSACRELPRELKITFIRLAVGLVVFIISCFKILGPTACMILGIAAFIICGYRVILNMFRDIREGEIFSENVLMSVSGIIAVIIGEIPEAVLIMLLFEIGESLQDLAADNSRVSIKKLVDMRPDTVTLLKDGETEEVRTETVTAGSLFVVPPGGRISLDGEIVRGETSVDTSPITGESLPIECGVGDKVTSGCINISDTIVVKASVSYYDSTMAHVMRLVENAETQKGKTESFITRFCNLYTPLVFLAAIIVGGLVPWIGGLDFKDWIHRALVLLVASCPCALIISIPIAYFAGIGGASKKGILFKNANTIDGTANLTSVIYDKTGTLTNGRFEVVNIEPVRISKDELLYLAALAEAFSTHPLAKSICRYYGKQIDTERIANHKEERGRGSVVRLVTGETIIAGNAEFMDAVGASYTSAPEGATSVYVAVGKTCVGRIDLSDQVKDSSAIAVSELRSMGIANVAMMTGDNALSAMRTGRELDISEIYSDCLPQDKVERVEYLKKLQKKGETLAFVGDGINDVPVIAAADVGVSMGAMGSEAAIEAADIVIMTDEPVKVAEALKISKKIKRIIYMNVAVVMAVKILVMILGVCGIAPVWLAVFADSGLALLAVLNSIRLIKE